MDQRDYGDEDKPATIPVKELLSFCHNCGEKGPHLAPPSMGDPSFYICDPNPELVEQKVTELREKYGTGTVSEA